MVSTTYQSIACPLALNRWASQSPPSLPLIKFSDWVLLHIQTMIFKLNYELLQLLLFHFGPLHPSSTISHMTTYYILLHVSSLLRLWSWGWGDAKGEGLLQLTDGQAKLMKNWTVPCSTAPPSLGLYMKPHHAVLFFECRILRDWVFMLPVISFSHEATYTLSSILHWINRLCSLLCSSVTLKGSFPSGCQGVRGNGNYWQVKAARGLEVSHDVRSQPC